MKQFIKDCLSYKWRWNRKKFWLYPIWFTLIFLIPLFIILTLSSLGQFWLWVTNAINIETTWIDSMNNYDSNRNSYESNSNILFYITTTLFFIIIVTMYIWITYVSIVSYIKRLHDLDKSGWFTLLIFVPFANIYIFIICGFFKWTNWENRFWNDPLGWIKSDILISKEL